LSAISETEIRVEETQKREIFIFFHIWDRCESQLIVVLVSIGDSEIGDANNMCIIYARSRDRSKKWTREKLTKWICEAINSRDS
jgi:hypothetical protein